MFRRPLDKGIRQIRELDWTPRPAFIENTALALAASKKNIVGGGERRGIN
jgi:hypothetical protein